MFGLALFIGVFSYLLFFLGLLRLLYPSMIYGLFVISVCVFICLRLKQCKVFFHSLNKIRLDQKSILVLCLIISLTVVNLIGVLGPEYAFDSLWYHLTFPKLYLLEHTIRFYPGGILLYSVMPKLAEVLYILPLSFGSEVFVKLTHFSFGLLVLVALYQFSRRYTNKFFSLLVVLIFSSNIVFAWESTTAYIDLVRTLYELLALWAFCLWIEKEQIKWLFLSAVLVGFAVATKLLGLGSLAIFIMLMAVHLRKKKDLILQLKHTLFFSIVSVSIVLPWFIFSFFNTGNPLYPFFTPLYKTTFDITLLNPFLFLWESGKLFLTANDSVSPIYLMVIPLVFFQCKKLRYEGKILAAYCFLALLVWYVTPHPGGGRFILPYLPAFSLLTAIIIEKIQKNTLVYRSLLFAVFLLAFITLAYRGVANSRFIPVLLGQETKAEFLQKHLSFDFGDFYDTDGYFKSHIAKNDKVLLYGFHNLYYVDFPFIDASYVKKGDRFNYIATQNTRIPVQYNNWKLIYKNDTTHVRLYKDKGKIWYY